MYTDKERLETAQDLRENHDWLEAYREGVRRTAAMLGAEHGQAARELDSRLRRMSDAMNTAIAILEDGAS